jgi:WD40 repeat protein
VDHLEQDYLYDAFISYRRSDGASVANWLRRRLQDYTLPPAIADGRKKLRIYLDTAFERANEDFWANNIEPALRASRYMVVVATPDTLLRRAGGQNWVEREIDLFLNLPHGRNILAVRAKGEFGAELPGGLMERFPQISIIDLRAFSSTIDRLHERAHLREHIVTILGTLHNIDSSQMPELRMEDAHNARRAATRLAMVAITLFMLISGLAIAAFVQRNIARVERNNAQAEARRADDNAGQARRETKIADDNLAEAKRQTGIATKNEDEAKRQQRIAEENARIAERRAAEARARELATDATESLNQDPELSLLLALEAVNSTTKVRESPVPAAENAVQNAVFFARARLTFRRHSGYVTAVAFSSDGKRVATGSADHTVMVWDAASGEVLLTLSAPYVSIDASFGSYAPINGVAFSPDGARLAVASWDTAKVWDSANGKEQLTLHDSKFVTAVTFSPDGRRIATGNTEPTTRLWDAVTGSELMTLRAYPTVEKGLLSTPSISVLAFTADGTRLAAGGSKVTMSVWDLSTGRELPALRGQLNEVKSVAFSADGKRLAAVVANSDHTAEVWDTVSGKKALTVTGHSDYVDSVAFSPDGKLLATGSWDKTAKLWDAEIGQELATLYGHSDSVEAVAFSPDGARLATASRDTTAKIWDMPGEPELVTLRGNLRAVDPMAFSRDGKRVAAAGYHQPAKIWDAITGQELVTLHDHADCLSAFAVSGVTALSFSSDGTRLATGGNGGAARVWNALSGECLLTLATNSGRAGEPVLNSVDAVAFSPDGTRLVTATPNETVKVWDAASGRELLTLHGQSGVGAVAFSPDGKRMATANSDMTGQVWDAFSGQKLVSLKGHSGFLYALAFSPDGRRVATTSADATAIVWDAASGRALLTLRGHSNPVTSVCFSPDGKRVATASVDRTVRVWDAVNGQELITLHTYLMNPNTVVFSPDGRRLATSSLGQVQFYTLDVPELLQLARKRVARKPPGFTAGECKRYFPSQVCPTRP